MRNFLCFIIIAVMVSVGSCVPKDLNVLLENLSGKDTTSEEPASKDDGSRRPSSREEASKTQANRYSSSSYGLNAFQKAQQAANIAQNERGDYETAIQVWKDLLPSYDGKKWPYTTGVIYSNIGYLYSQKKDFGKALEYADKSDRYLDEVDKVGILKLDDDGAGGLISEKDPRYRDMGVSPKTMFDVRRNTNNIVRMQYYRAAGESDKADAIGRKLSLNTETQAQDIYESTKKSQITALRIQAEYDKSLTEEEIQRRAEEAAREVQEKNTAYRMAQEEKTTLRTEILRASRSGDVVPDTLIDRYVALQIEQNPMGDSMYEANAKSYEQYNQHGVARDYRRLGEHHKENVTKPWGMAIKATILLDANRPEDALRVLEQAYVKMNNPQPLPQLETDQGRAWFQSMGAFINKDLIAWDFLKAQILTRMNDPHALAAWDGVISELNKPPPDLTGAGPYAKQAAQTAAIMRQTVLGERYQELAATEIAALYEKVGRRGEGLAYIDHLLKTRESARASFSVEAHKRGYLAANKRLYERFLTLSATDPDMNLLGMERAKSRAMVDLMAGGIGNMDDPTLRMVAKHRQAAANDAEKQAAQRTTRGQVVAGLDKGLESLKKSNPELHSLVSVDVAGAETLAALLGSDTIALSYYISDNALFINVIGDNVSKVVMVPVAKASLFGAVYDYRQRLLNPSAKRSQKVGKVSVDWTIDQGTQRIIVKNDMPFPLEIRGINSIYRSHVGGSMFPYLPMGYSMQFSAKSLVETIPPGKKATVFEQEQYGGSWTYSNDIENYIETNLGSAYTSGLLVTQQGKDDELTVYEEIGFTYTPLKQSLYDVLIKPVEPYITGKRLVIVPHSVLHFLPYETLKDGQDRYLIEKHAVSYAPSLNALRLNRMKNRGKATKLVAYGDPLGDLKYARREVNEVRNLFDESVVLSGQQVTKSSVTSTIGQGDIIHFACHGIFNPASPLDSALVMASGEHGQSLGRLSIDDLNLLTVGDIMRLKTNPSLVFLSACDTGRARVSGGDELIGLVRGFFVAGSPSLVTTLWPIDDESTAMLAVRFYENLLKRNMDKSQALQEAKLYLMQHGFKDPYYWAAFVLQGDWQ